MQLSIIPMRDTKLDESKTNEFLYFARELLPILEVKINQSISKEVIVGAISALNNEIISGYYAMDPEKILNTKAPSARASEAIASTAESVASDLESPIKKRKMDEAPATVVDSPDNTTIFRNIKNIDQATSTSAEGKVRADRMILGFKETTPSTHTNAIKPPSSPKVIPTTQGGPAK